MRKQAANNFNHSIDATAPLLSETSVFLPVDGKTLLEVRNLRVFFKSKRKVVNVVRGVDLKIQRGEIVGIVGESGSGKSVMTKALLNINPGTITVADSARLHLEDQSFVDLDKLKDFTGVRGSKIGYIPQDPMSSLNPSRKIWKQIQDVLLLFRKDLKTKADRINYMVELLTKFGMRNARERIFQYPHVLSGGMKQRVVIAMVVACRPSLIIADEPTTALDTTVQASVLELLEMIRREYNISIIFISHNIAVVAKFVNYIYVVYCGKIVERGTKQEILTDPRHPYTWALLSALPDQSEDKLDSIPGRPPSLEHLPAGDPFAARNPYALEVDFRVEPPLIPITKTHAAATWLLHPKAPKVTVPARVKKIMQQFKRVFGRSKQRGGSDDS